MISELSNIGRTIDSLVSGVIQFFYSIVEGVVRIYVKPLKGSLWLRQNKLMSSTTLLFLACSAVIAFVLYGESAAKELIKASPPNLMVYVTVVVVLYVVVDICARILSVWCARRGRRRVRALACLRFTLAAILFGWVTVTWSWIYVDGKYIAPDKFLGNLFLIIELLPVVCLVLSYPLLINLFCLGRAYRGAGPLPVFGVGVLAATAALVMMTSVPLQARLGGMVGASLVDEVVEPDTSPLVSGFSCNEFAGEGMLRIRAIVYNPSNAPVVIGEGGLRAEIGRTEDEEGEEEIMPLSLYFPKQGEPLIGIAAGATSALTFEQKIDAPLRETLSAHRTCLVTVNVVQDPSQLQPVSEAPDANPRTPSRRPNDG